MLFSILTRPQGRVQQCCQRCEEASFLAVDNVKTIPDYFLSLPFVYQRGKKKRKANKRLLDSLPPIEEIVLLYSTEKIDDGMDRSGHR